MNCITENEAIMIPKPAGVAPNATAYEGKRGITMPNPVESIKMVIKIMKLGEGKKLSRCLMLIQLLVIRYLS